MSEADIGIQRPAGEVSAPCRLCEIGQELHGRVELDETTLRFVPAGAPASDAVSVRFSQVVRARLRPAAGTVTLATYASASVTLRTEAEGYTRIAAKLRAVLPGVPMEEDEPAVSVPRQGGAVRCELNSLLTVGGQFYVDGARVWFEPGLDARVFLRRAFEAPTHEVRAVRQLSGGRRVSMNVGEREFVLRGPSAQRIWVALCALRDTALSVRSVEPFFLADDGSLDTGGLFAIGASGFGYGASGTLGLAQSFWESVRELCFIRPDGEMLAIGCRARSHSLPAGGHAAVSSTLRERWLASCAEPQAQGDCFQVDAIMSRDGDIRFGTLGVVQRGVVYTPLDGEPVLLAARGALVRVSVEEGSSNVLRIAVQDGVHRVSVPHAGECAGMLEGIFGYPSWTTPDDYAEESPLSDDDFAEVVGVAAYTNLIYQGEVVASAAGPVLAPQGLRVQIAMLATGMDRQPPFSATLEVGNKRGRFMVSTVVTEVRDEKVRSPGGVNASPPLAVSLKFTGRIRQRNRRDFFRLPVGERLVSIRYVARGKPQAHTGDIWLMDFSRGGCGLLLPVPLELGLLCTLEVLTDGELVVTLRGRVVRCSADPDKKHRVGISFTPDSTKLAADLFGQRERAALQRRRQREDRK